MAPDFFDPTAEQQIVVLIDARTLRKAEQLIESCEHCNRGGAEIPFDNILDRVTGSDPSVTDYILEVPEMPELPAGSSGKDIDRTAKPHAHQHSLAAAELFGAAVRNPDLKIEQIH